MLLLAFFYLAGSALSFSFAIFFIREPVISIIFLIAVFLCSAISMILIQATFFAMIMTIVYVGAITILFLFVVMMLPEHHVQKGSSFLELKKPEVFLSQQGYLYFFKIFVLWAFASLPFYLPTLMHFLFVKDTDGIVSKAYGINARDIGTIFYLEYAVIFQAGGGILLIAMVGSILLCMRDKDRSVTRRQSIIRQVGRHKGVVLHSMAPGEGIMRTKEDP